MVLIFNGAQVLVAVTRSLHSAAELTKGNLQAISFCCTGKYVCSGGLYFRHLHPDVEIELADLGTLMLKDYDALCGEKRTYYPVRKMAHKRALLETNVSLITKRKEEIPMRENRNVPFRDWNIRVPGTITASSISAPWIYAIYSSGTNCLKTAPSPVFARRH